MNDKHYFSGFNDRLKEVLEENKLSQVEVSQRIGISKHTLTKYLNGERLPETSILFALSKFFGKSMEWFLEGKEEEPQYKSSKKFTQPLSSSKILAREGSRETNLPDSELEQMCAVLKKLMENEDPNMRGWTIIQFKKAFGEYYTGSETVNTNYPKYIVDRKST